MKKRRSNIEEQAADILDKVGALNKATESTHLDVVSVQGHKTECYKAKMDAHSQEQERQLLRDQIRSTREDAELNHRHSQESKEAEIRHLEAEAKAAVEQRQLASEQARVHAAEAEALRLKIEYHKLCNS